MTRPTAPVAPTTPIRMSGSTIAPVYGRDAKDPKKTLNRLTRRPAGSVGATYVEPPGEMQPPSRRKAAICEKNVAGYIARRPASARPSVTSSAYSRSPPTGSPLARRVTCTRPRRRSARYAAVASPVMVGLVARTTSVTPFASTRPDEPVDAQVSRLDAVERRQRAAEDVVQAAVLAGALDRDDVHGLLHDADDRPVATCVRADRAELLLREVPALAAEADAGLHVLDRPRQLERVLRTGREHVECEPLRRSAADPRKLRELRDEVLDGRAQHGRSLAVRFGHAWRVYACCAGTESLHRIQATTDDCGDGRAAKSGARAATGTRRQPRAGACRSVTRCRGAHASRRAPRRLATGLRDARTAPSVEPEPLDWLSRMPAYAREAQRRLRRPRHLVAHQVAASLSSACS